MSDPRHARFALTSLEPETASPRVTGVAVDGQLDDPRFVLTVRQTYRNDGPHALEAAYTFVLPCRASLLRFTTERRGLRREERVDSGLPRPAGGCAAVHTAHFGRLLTGEEIVLELRIAQVLVIEHGAMRALISAAVAPDMGDAYPVSIAVSVAGSLHGAGVRCATHALARQPIDGGVRLAMASQGGLRRDVVIDVSLAETRPSRATAASAGGAPATLRQIALAVVEHLAHGGQSHGLAAHCQALRVHPQVQRALSAVQGLGCGEGHAWLLLAHWANERPLGLTSTLVARTLAPHLPGLGPRLVDQAYALFAQMLHRQAAIG